MIKIDIWCNGFIVQGHANAGSYGNDLVCAGVSAIVLGALNWFDATKCKLVMNNDGYVALMCNPDESQNQLYLELLQKQLCALPKDSSHLSINIHKGKKYEL